MEPEELMRQAIATARAGILAGQSPFGCAIYRHDLVIACRHNTVLATPDVTAHAEINALRTACQVTGRVHLEGARVAATCEPCPMCIAALHWARVAVVYYGASIEDARQAGFNELQLPAEQFLTQCGSSIQLVGGVLQDECRALFQQWLQHPGHRSD